MITGLPPIKRAKSASNDAVPQEAGVTVSGPATCMEVPPDVYVTGVLPLVDEYLQVRPGRSASNVKFALPTVGDVALREMKLRFVMVMLELPSLQTEVVPAPDCTAVTVPLPLLAVTFAPIVHLSQVSVPRLVFHFAFVLTAVMTLFTGTRVPAGCVSEDALAVAGMAKATRAPAAIASRVSFLAMIDSSS
jgi:hypothetical protein